MLDGLPLEGRAISTVIFESGAPLIAEVISWTFAGTWLNSETITVQVGTKSVTVTTGSATIATFLATLQAALAALTSTAYPEFFEITWTAGTSTLTATAKTAGKPIAVTISTNSASGTINGGSSSTGTITTANSGPNCWDVNANWSTNLVPVGACSPPVQSNATASSGGSLSNGTTYYWVITATNPNGETTVSNEKSLAITTPNQTADLAWAAVTNATGYKIYRSTTSGTYGATSLVTTIANGATVTYNDTGSATTTGQPPVSSTAIGDTVYLSRENTVVKYGLDQHGVILTALYATAKSLTLGLPQTNQDGTSYSEYRSDFLKIQSPSVYVNSKTQRFKLDTGSATACAFQQDGSGKGIEQNVPAVLLRGTNSGNTWSIFGGEAGLAFFAGDTLNANTLRAANGVTVTCGLGCTLATVSNEGASITINSNIGTLLSHPSGSGTTYVYSTATCAQLKIYSGTVDWRSSGDFSTGGNALIAGNATLTCDNEPVPGKSIAHTVQLYSSGRFLDNTGTCGTITLQNMNSPSIQVGLGLSYTIQRTIV